MLSILLHNLIFFLHLSFFQQLAQNLLDVELGERGWYEVSICNYTFFDCQPSVSTVIVINLY